MTAGLNQNAVDPIAHHFGDSANPTCDDDGPGLKSLLDGDQEAFRPQERQDHALRVFQPGSAGLAAHRRIKEEDIERILNRARAWRRRRLDAIRENLLDCPTEKAPL